MLNKAHSFTHWRVLLEDRVCSRGVWCWCEMFACVCVWVLQQPAQCCGALRMLSYPDYEQLINIQIWYSSIFEPHALLNTRAWMDMWSFSSITGCRFVDDEYPIWVWWISWLAYMWVAWINIKECVRLFIVCVFVGDKFSTNPISNAKCNGMESILWNANFVLGFRDMVRLSHVLIDGN